MNYPLFQQNGLVQVTGLEGAKAYRMPPNSAVALFHNTEDIFYVKTTDGAGFPTIRAFKFEEINTSNEHAEFITRNEFDELRGMIEDVKLSISEQQSNECDITSQTSDAGKPTSPVQSNDEWQSKIPSVR